MTALPQRPSHGDGRGTHSNVRRRIDPPHSPAEDLPALFRLPDLSGPGRGTPHGGNAAPTGDESSKRAGSAGPPQSADDQAYQPITTSAKVAGSRLAAGRRRTGQTAGFTEISVAESGLETSPGSLAVDPSRHEERTNETTHDTPRSGDAQREPDATKARFPEVDLALETWGSRVMMITLLLLIVGFAAIAVRGLRKSSQTQSADAAAEDAGQESVASASDLLSDAAQPVDVPVELLLDESTDPSSIEVVLDKNNLGQEQTDLMDGLDPPQSEAELLAGVQTDATQSGADQENAVSDDSFVDVMPEIEFGDTLDFNDPFFRNMGDTVSDSSNGGDAGFSDQDAADSSAVNSEVGYVDGQMNQDLETGSDGPLDPAGSMEAFPDASQYAPDISVSTPLPDSNVTLGGPVASTPDFSATVPEPYAEAYDDGSMAYQYSTTPLGVTDWSRYFPSNTAYVDPGGNAPNIATGQFNNERQ